MRRIQTGFTLIELMIVVAIVGILAAVALPAYQDYVIRSKMSEALAALAACKTSVTEYTMVNKDDTSKMLALNADTAGCSTISSQYVSTLTVHVVPGIQPIIEITATATGTGIADCNITLQANSADGWFGATTCDTKYVPANFR